MRFKKFTRIAKIQRLKISDFKYFVLFCLLDDLLHLVIETVQSSQKVVSSAISRTHKLETVKNQLHKNAKLLFNYIVLIIVQ